MRRQPWRAALLVLGGGVAGIAVAGLPSRHQDPPLRVNAVETTTSVSVATTAAPTTTTTNPPTTSTTSTTAKPTTSTTKKRP
jgi:hypothetical protein